MKIQRLELVGFKSFMEKTTLHFEDGITAVIGPNGCGKSNIVDAIFWVMGDQSAKHLRGREMEDIIFAGTQNKPSAGMAEVSITFSTEGVVGPYAHYPEITISRRLYRSGDSEYLINKVSCRLKDILEFFMDTGIGAKAYSIIEQGQIGKIVSQKPEERRSLIEEAAGITKFKSRKREATLKMEGTEQNLLRINDIMLEIKRQIDSLERQAKKAEKYKLLKEQIREIELTAFSHDYKNALKKCESLETSFRKYNEEHEASSVNIQKEEASLEKTKLFITEKEKELGKLQEHFYAQQQKIQELENQKEIKKKEIENWKLLEEKDSKDKEHLDMKKQQFHKSEKNMLLALEELNKEENSLKNVLDQKELELKSENQKYEILAQKIESEKTELFSFVSQESQCHNRISYLEQNKKSAEEKWNRFLEEEETLNEEYQKIQHEKKNIESQMADSEHHKQTVIKNKSEIENQLKSLKENLSQAILKRDQVKEQFQSVGSRLLSLQEIERNLEGYEEGPRTLLSQNELKQTKILGTLIDHVEIDEMYEKALEVILKEKLQCIIVRDKKTALELIDYLKQKEVGQSYFIPLEGNPILTAETSSMEPLWKKIKVKHPEYEILFQMLLKNVYVVSDIKLACDAWDKAPYQFTFVTPQGEMIHSSGIILGGKPKNTLGLLSQKREIKTLESAKKELEEVLKKCDQQVLEISTHIENNEKEIQKLTKEIHEKEVSQVSFSKDFSKNEEDLERIEEEREVLQFEKEQHSLMQKELLAELNKEKNNKLLLSEKKKVKETTLEIAKLTYQKVIIDLENQKKAVQEMKLQEVSFKEKKEALNRQKEHLVQNIQALDKEIDEKIHSIQSSLECQNACKEDIQKLAASIEENIRALETLKVQLSSSRETFDQELHRSRTMEEEIKKMRSHLNQLETESHQYNLEMSQVQMTMKHIKEQVQERYMVDLEAIANRYDDKMITDEDKQRCNELKEKVARMGEVNLTAIQEFDELNQRYQTLEVQKQDLLQSLDSLKKTIEKINRITRQRFEETFEIVNKNFKRVFPVLFNGGEAQLILTDQNDLLESGVDIMAKPPGKKLQNMNLLSGGEKALTAISLIFAVFLMKPSPFCLLDEVDAPLDDANVERFNEMVQKMTTHSQFIVITHNKKTMEKADILYGITMEHPGISNIISVKLEKAIQMVDTRSKTPLRKEVSV